MPPCQLKGSSDMRSMRAFARLFVHWFKYKQLICSCCDYIRSDSRLLSTLSALLVELFCSFTKFSSFHGSVLHRLLSFWSTQVSSCVVNQDWIISGQARCDSLTATWRLCSRFAWNAQTTNKRNPFSRVPIGISEWAWTMSYGWILPKSFSFTYKLDDVVENAWRSRFTSYLWSGECMWLWMHM